MARRNASSPQDPESEEARQERDSIVGVKNQAENEMLSLAEVNKNLEKKIKDNKILHDQELLDQKKQKQIELEEWDRKIALKKQLHIDLTQQNETLSNEKIKIENSIEPLKKNLDAYLAIKHRNDIELADLQKEKTRIEKAILLEEVRIGTFKRISAEIRNLISNGEKSYAEISEKLFKLSKELETVNIELISGNQNVANAKIKLQEIIPEITKKNNELLEVKTSLEKLRGEEATLSVSIKKKENDINDKTKNLILLEERVDEKLEIFSRFKEKFSVDELAKMKIHANLV